MSTPEGRFKKNVILFLKSLPNCYYFVKEACALRGIPDIICCINGKFVALELKKSEKEASKTTGRIVLQMFNIAKIIRLGGHGYIVYPGNFDDIKMTLTKLSKDNSNRYFVD